VDPHSEVLVRIVTSYHNGAHQVGDLLVRLIDPLWPGGERAALNKAGELSGDRAKAIIPRCQVRPVHMV
jgi:hypothetical protein